jgi:hypothetical protein
MRVGAALGFFKKKIALGDLGEHRPTAPKGQADAGETKEHHAPGARLRNSGDQIATDVLP